MTKLYFQPIEVQCQGRDPAAFLWRGTKRRIQRVLNRWSLRTDWWRGKVVSRCYYKVECEDLGVYEIYQHETGWVLERVYD